MLVVLLKLLVLFELKLEQLHDVCDWNVFVFDARVVVWAMRDGLPAGVFRELVVMSVVRLILFNVILRF